MAKHRLINTRFWEDGYIMNLSPDEKTLFIYFLTSPLSNIAGIYECPLKIIAPHTGLDRDVVKAMIPRFAGKIHYIDGWIYIRNFIKYQSSKSKTVKKGIEIAYSEVPPKIKKKIAEIEQEYREDEEAVGFTLFDLDSVNEELEDIKEVSNETKKNIESVAKYYVEKIKPTSLITKNVRDKIKTRLEEYSVTQLKEGIDNFSADDWRMKNNSDKGMVWFFSSDAQVLKWIEMEPKVKEVRQSVKI